MNKLLVEKMRLEMANNNRVPSRWLVGTSTNAILRTDSDLYPYFTPRSGDEGDLFFGIPFVMRSDLQPYQIVLRTDGDTTHEISMAVHAPDLTDGAG